MKIWQFIKQVFTGNTPFFLRNIAAAEETADTPPIRSIDDPRDIYLA